MSSSGVASVRRVKTCTLHAARTGRNPPHANSATPILPKACAPMPGAITRCCLRPSSSRDQCSCQPSPRLLSSQLCLTSPFPAVPSLIRASKGAHNGFAQRTL